MVYSLAETAQEPCPFYSPGSQASPPAPIVRFADEGSWDLPKGIRSLGYRKQASYQ